MSVSIDKTRASVSGGIPPYICKISGHNTKTVKRTETGSFSTGWGSDGWGDHCTVSDVSITCTDSIGKKKSKTREVKGSGTCK